MSYDPFRNYDAWLTTDQLGEEQEAAAERLDALWCSAVDEHDLPYEANEDDHPQHAVYEAWLAFVTAADQYHMQQEADAEAAYYAEQDGICDGYADWPTRTLCGRPAGHPGECKPLRQPEDDTL